MFRILKFSTLLVFFLIVGLITPAQTSQPTLLDKGKALFDVGDYRAARQAFHEGAQSGDTRSAYYLARMLELGVGIEVDPTAAANLYRQSAGNGNKEAQNRVALMYYHGDLGVKQDDKQAAYFLS